ncbi:hypothetical protein RJ641_008833, partial [Dillenia turbinata]
MQDKAIAPCDYPNKVGDNHVPHLLLVINLGSCSSISWEGNCSVYEEDVGDIIPEIHFILENHPAPFGKRLLAKLVPVMQIGVIGVIITGEQIIPMMSIATPPQLYLSLRANRFGVIASTWLIGNFLQSPAQSSGAFKVHYHSKSVSSFYPIPWRRLM